VSRSLPGCGTSERQNGAKFPRRGNFASLKPAGLGRAKVYPNIESITAVKKIYLEKKQRDCYNVEKLWINYAF